MDAGQRVLWWDSYGHEICVCHRLALLGSTARRVRRAEEVEPRPARRPRRLLRGRPRASISRRDEGRGRTENALSGNGRTTARGPDSTADSHATPCGSAERVRSRTTGLHAGTAESQFRAILLGDGFPPPSQGSSHHPASLNFSGNVSPQVNFGHFRRASACYSFCLPHDA